MLNRTPMHDVYPHWMPYPPLIETKPAPKAPAWLGLPPPHVQLTFAFAIPAARLSHARSTEALLAPLATGAFPPFPALSEALLTFDLSQYREPITDRLPYAHAPHVIEQLWAVLIPAIVEMTWHARRSEWDLFQHMRSAKKRMQSVNMGAEFTPDRWVMGVLLATGLLPREEIDDELFSARKKSLKYDALLKPINTSPQSRNEALMCLEMLGSQVWRMRHIKGMQHAQIFPFLYQALKYMYWESGTPQANGLHDCEQDDCGVRRIIYRHARQMESLGEIPALVHLIRSGTACLMQYRLSRPAHFRRMLCRDPRWNHTLASHIAFIEDKYRVSESLAEIPDCEDR